MLPKMDQTLGQPFFGMDMVEKISNLLSFRMVQHGILNAGKELAIVI
jgi:hypothetical protein